MTVVVRRPDAAAFEPYGAFLEPPGDAGERAMFGDWLRPVPGCVQQCHLNRVAPSTLPLKLDRVERHPHAAQLFLPMGEVSRYLVTVMPSDESGAPDPDRAEAFVVPGSLGVVYRPGTWHAGIAVLGGEGSFAVMMWRGREDDDVFVAIPSLVVRPADSVAREQARV